MLIRFTVPVYLSKSVVRSPKVLPNGCNLSTTTIPPPAGFRFVPLVFKFEDREDFSGIIWSKYTDIGHLVCVADNYVGTSCVRRFKTLCQDDVHRVNHSKPSMISHEIYPIPDTNTLFWLIIFFQNVPESKILSAISCFMLSLGTFLLSV